MDVGRLIQFNRRLLGLSLLLPLTLLPVLSRARTDHAAKALIDRCRAGALAAGQMRQALDDCNAALTASATDAMRLTVLDSRGFVYLRLGDYQRAFADYDRALRLQPNRPTSLYGRGVAEKRLGRTSAGQVDTHDATALDPTVNRPFRQAGLVP